MGNKKHQVKKEKKQGIDEAMLSALRALQIVRKSEEGKTDGANSAELNRLLN